MIIARIYGAAGHGKGLIDAMSSFGVKSIIRKDIVTHDVWFDSAEDIADYLKRRNNGRMEYTVINRETVNQKRRNIREGLRITGCMRMHLILFSPNKEITLKEYLCDCNECINLNFDDCLLENKDGMWH